MVHVGLDGEGGLLVVIEEIVTVNGLRFGLARYRMGSVDQPFPTRPSALCHKIMYPH